MWSGSWVKLTEFKVIGFFDGIKSSLVEVIQVELLLGLFNLHYHFFFFTFIFSVSLLLFFILLVTGDTEFNELLDQIVIGKSFEVLFINLNFSVKRVRLLQVAKSFVNFAFSDIEVEVGNFGLPLFLWDFWLLLAFDLFHNADKIFVSDRSGKKLADLLEILVKVDGMSLIAILSSFDLIDGETWNYLRN